MIQLFYIFSYLVSIFNTPPYFDPDVHPGLEDETAGYWSEADQIRENSHKRRQGIIDLDQLLGAEPCAIQS